MPSYGTVKYYNVTKGYGFITQEEPGPDVFFLRSIATAGGCFPISKGERVVFEIERMPNGMRAKTMNRETGDPF